MIDCMQFSFEIEDPVYLNFDHHLRELGVKLGSGLTPTSNVRPDPNLRAQRAQIATTLGDYIKKIVA